MAAVTFDTHNFVRRLKGAGFSEQQAEALTEAVRDSHESSDLATKADLREYESAIRRDLEKLEMRMDAKFANVDAKLEKLGLQLTIRLGVIVAAVVTLAPIISKFFLHLN